MILLRKIQLEKNRIVKSFTKQKLERLSKKIIANIMVGKAGYSYISPIERIINY